MPTERLCCNNVQRLFIDAWVEINQNQGWCPNKGDVGFLWCIPGLACAIIFAIVDISDEAIIESAGLVISWIVQILDARPKTNIQKFIVQLPLGNQES